MKKNKHKTSKLSIEKYKTRNINEFNEAKIFQNS